MPEQQQVSVPSGLLACTTYGPIRHETAQCLLEARSFNETNGLKNIEYMTIPGSLVEKARNEAVRMMFRKGHGFIFFVDGDCTFEPNAIMRIIQTAYGEMPWADAVGGWCPLRGELSLPTTDFGSGTWESSFPGSGTLEVIRTGGAFLMAKRPIFEALKDPWFRMRVPSRPLDFLLETDNFLRIKFNGNNPFRNLPGREWEQAEESARNDPSVVAEQFVPAEVGEDSGWCDRTRNAGFRIFVNTDVACGHVDSVIRTWQDHRKAMDANELMQRQVCGILT